MILFPVEEKHHPNHDHYNDKIQHTQNTSTGLCIFACLYFWLMERNHTYAITKSRLATFPENTLYPVSESRRHLVAKKKKKKANREPRSKLGTDPSDNIFKFWT